MHLGKRARGQSEETGRRIRGYLCLGILLNLPTNTARREGVASPKKDGMLALSLHRNHRNKFEEGATEIVWSFVVSLRSC